MTDADLFTYADTYPHSPGYRAASETSKEAAQSIKPRMGRLQRLVLNALLQRGPMTPDECAAALGIDLLSIRPRFVELSRRSLIAPTGERRANKSGLKAQVWCAL